MDPLSLTASIIAVVQISGAIISLCYEYRTGVKDAAKEATRITEELKSFQDVLERLLKLAEVEVARASSRLQTIQPLLEPGGVLSRCQDDLKALQLKLAPETGVKMLMKKLKWPLTEKEVKKAIEDVARARETISLALITDQTAISLAIKDTIDTVAITQKKFVLEDTRVKVHQWLQAPDPYTNHYYARKLSHSGTGSWLLQDPHYAAWKSGTASSLWLHGIPGSGKTVICSTVIEDLTFHCQKHALHALMIFYFDFNDAEKQRCGSVLRSVIAQLLTQYPETPEAIRKLFDEQHYRLLGNAIPDAILLTALQKTISLLSECYIVFDALDEARPHEEVLDLVGQILSWNMPNLHLLVTSRREMDMESTLSPLITHKIEMQKSLVDADVSLYIQTRLDHDSRLKKWPPGVKAEIKDTLIKGADGMFRWVVCQFDVLAKCVKLPKLQATLRSLPRTLEDTYSRILLSIDQEYVRDAISVLRWLAFSARPLHLEEVVEVLAIDWEVNEKPTFDLEFRLPDPLDLLTICSSLVTLKEGMLDNRDASAPQKRTFVRLAHSSVKDYLISDRISTSPAAAYALNEALSHSFITQCCLIYLLQFKGPLEPRSPLTFPLVQYAAQFWTDHFQASGVTDKDEVENMAFQVLTSDQVPYVNWCHLYDPDRPWLVQSDPVDPPNGPDRPNGHWKEADGSPLYYMSLLGLSQLCKRLLAAGADANASGGLYGSPLRAAAMNGHGDVVELLLDSNANPNRTKRLEGTPLLAAASRGYRKIIESLLSHGVEVDNMPINALFAGPTGTALAAAAGNGHERVVQILLDAGANPDRFNRKGGNGPPIVQAASNGHVAVVRQLLPSSHPIGIQMAIIEAASGGHESVVRQLLETEIPRELALSCAARVGAHDMVSRLIDEGTGVNAEPNNEPTPLESAIKGGHETIVQQLISEGASYKPDMLSVAARFGHTHLLQHLIRQYFHDSVVLSESLFPAVHYGYMSMVEILLDNGADIEFQQAYRGRPLHVAAKFGNLDVVKLLLDRGAYIDSESVTSSEVESKQSGPDSALQFAASEGYLPIVQYLIEHGADLDKYGYSQQNALQHAASSGHILVIEELLAAGANLNSIGQMGSALHCAISGSQPDTVRLLLQSGANGGEFTDIEEEDTPIWPNPLLLASRNGEFQIVKVLLDAGMDPNEPSILWGNSELPIHAAAQIGNIDILQVLLEHGANVNAQAEEDGFSAIHFAAGSGHHDALRFLLVDHHANPEVRLFNGSLALHSAASQGYPKCIEVCLEAGLDVSSQNSQGRTALHWAAEQGQKAAVEKLLAEGVDVKAQEVETGMTALDLARQKAYEQPENKNWKGLVKLLKAKT